MQLEKIQDQQNIQVQKREQELTTLKGTNTFEDHRPYAVYQRKLRHAMYMAADKSNAIQRKTSGTSLPGKLKSGIENLSGYAMDDVKVHYNSSKPAQLRAHAYAQGTDIHLAPGQEKHLPHEAWHVVQQKQGRVKPTIQLKEHLAINDDVRLEREADVMGSKSLAQHSEVITPVPLRKSQPSLKESNMPPPIQRMVISVQEPRTIDSTIAADIQFNLINFGGDLVLFNNLEENERGTYAIQNNEVIVVTGHGAPGAVFKNERESVNGRRIGNAIKKIENYENAAFIYLSSCNAAAKPQNGQSLVNITYRVINSRVRAGRRKSVYGAPAEAIADYDSITGDVQSTVITLNKDEASFTDDIEVALQLLYFPKMQENVKAKNERGIIQRGNELLREGGRLRLFNRFYLGILSGEMQDADINRVLGDIQRYERRIRNKPGSKQVLKKPRLTATDARKLMESLRRAILDIKEGKAKSYATMASHGVKPLKGLDRNTEEKDRTYQELRDRP